MRNLILTLLALGTCLCAAPLQLVQGSLTAHTEVFGDATIDPTTSAITSALEMDGTPESITGTVAVGLRSLASDNAKRDEHMQEALASEQFPEARYTFGSVRKNAKGYAIDGSLTLHGVTKPLTLQATFEDDGPKLLMHGTGSLLMSDFGIVPPTLLFLTVRDQVDIRFDIAFMQ